MDLDLIAGYISFAKPSELVNWLFTSVPFVLLTVFLLNCIFGIFDVISGRRKK